MDQIQKKNSLRLRRELEAWRRGCVGLILLGCVVCALFSALLLRQERAAERWEAKYNAARAIGEDALRAYAALSAQTDAEREARKAQTAAYEELEGCQYIGVCEITYYCCEAYPHICGTGDGLTATGLPVAPGIVAVDPEVIELGSTVVINGTSYLAADTGVEGLHIDIAVPTHIEALEKGRETADVWVMGHD